MAHKILIVDDEAAVRETLRRFLVKSGYEVETAESGAQAIEMVSRQPFSLVLCDVMMPASPSGGPEMDGIETLTKIKQINKLLPVVMMSAFGTHDKIIQALGKDAVDFVAKPIRSVQVKNIVQKVLTPDLKPQSEYSSGITNFLRESYLNLLNMMIQLLEVRDPYIKDHGKRVAEYAAKIAQALKLDEDTIEVIHYAGILHDIGKIGIKDVILSKPDRLDSKEWEIMKMHPSIGCEIVEQLRLFRAEEPIIQYHHEWYDGTGYPNGLKGEAIPLGARILGVVDAYDAMTSSRPYRAPVVPGTARDIIKNDRGKQFDPKIAEVFLGII